MKAICASVHYADFLAITLPANAKHFDDMLVVTDSSDLETVDVVVSVPNARCFITDLFHANESRFNKGLAMEAGFDVLGREGWIVVWDADILMPDVMDFSTCEIGNLYSPYRRICRTRDRMNDAWETFPYGTEIANDEFAGYFQLFHADDPLLRFHPWYDGTKWTTARGCDSEFWWRWPKDQRIRPNWDVLHLGPERLNWNGRVTEKW